MGYHHFNQPQAEMPNNLAAQVFNSPSKDTMLWLSALADILGREGVNGITMNIHGTILSITNGEPPEEEKCQLDHLNLQCNYCPECGEEIGD